MSIKNRMLNAYDQVFKLGDYYNDFLFRHVSSKNMYRPTIPESFFSQTEGPVLYTQKGNQLDVYFMSSYGCPDGGNNMLFDYFNWGLKKHIYAGKEMVRTVGTPSIKLGYIGESRAIIPNEYRIVERHKEIKKEFDAIYTFDDRILNEFPNARFFPYAAQPWYGRNHADIIDSKAYEKKDKNISIISSNKKITRLHKTRIAVAKECNKYSGIDTYGSFKGDYCDDYDEVFRRYRYSIVIENDITDYYFTEKITSCFLSQTIPVYYGAKKIDEFFNSEGIIQVSKEDLFDIPKLIKRCTQQEYENRISAIIDNYLRVQEYDYHWDWWYRNYGKQISRC